MDSISLSSSDWMMKFLRYVHHFHTSFQMEDLRPVTEFLGTASGEIKPFSAPGTFGQTIVRFQKNLAYFKINYCILGFCVAIFSVITSPLTLFFIILLIGGWYWNINLIMTYSRDPKLLDNEVRIGAIITTPRILIYCACGVSVILIAMILRTILSWTLSVSTVLVALHAGFRDPINTRDELGSDDGDIETGEEKY
mmetsp:Transcript_25166/g.25371  ORF Transcript_25166/g.25371 Transcript_25166/m.25371 type:complete len:196 (+) Transcript_25166:249-836(+)